MGRVLGRRRRLPRRRRRRLRRRDGREGPAPVARGEVGPERRALRVELRAEPPLLALVDLREPEELRLDVVERLALLRELALPGLLVRDDDVAPVAELAPQLRDDAPEVDLRVDLGREARLRRCA